MLIIFILAMLAGDAFSCTYDTDCRSGQTCEQTEWRDSICVSHTNEAPIYTSPKQIDQHRGEVCYSFSDCGAGGSCIKYDKHSITGNCSR